MVSGVDDSESWSAEAGRFVFFGSPTLQTLPPVATTDKRLQAEQVQGPPRKNRLVCSGNVSVSDSMDGTAYHPNGTALRLRTPGIPWNGETGELADCESP